MDDSTKQRKSYAETAFRNEGKWMVLNHWSNYEIIVEELEHLDQPPIDTLGDTTGVMCLKLLSSGELVSAEFSIQLWDIQTGSYIETFGDGYGVLCLQELPSGKFALAYFHDSNYTIDIWDRQNGNCIMTLEGHTDYVRELQVLPTGELASASEDSTIKIWNLQTGSCIKTLQVHTHVFSLQVLPTGDVACGFFDGTIKIFDVQTGHCITTLEHHSGTLEETGPLDWQSGVVYCLKVLPSGELASGSDDRTVKIWHVPTGQFIKTLEGHADCVVSLEVLPSGDLASGSKDGTIKIWDVETGSCLKTLAAHTGTVECLQVLSNGDLASGSTSDRTIKIWKIPNRKKIPDSFAFFHFAIRGTP